MKRQPLSLNAEIRRLQKIFALLVCVQSAANEEVEFDVADALAVVIVLLKESVRGLDRIEVSTDTEARRGK